MYFGHYEVASPLSKNLFWECLFGTESRVKVEFCFHSKVFCKRYFALGDLSIYFDLWSKGAKHFVNLSLEHAMWNFLWSREKALFEAFTQCEYSLLAWWMQGTFVLISDQVTECNKTFSEHNTFTQTASSSYILTRCLWDRHTHTHTRTYAYTKTKQSKNITTQSVGINWNFLWHAYTVHLVFCFLLSIPHDAIRALAQCVYHWESTLWQGTDQNRFLFRAGHNFNHCWKGRPGISFP